MNQPAKQKHVFSFVRKNAVFFRQMTGSFVGSAGRDLDISVVFLQQELPSHRQRILRRQADAAQDQTTKEQPRTSPSHDRSITQFLDGSGNGRGLVRVEFAEIKRQAEKDRPA